MIPVFPKFKRLEFEDRAEYSSYTRPFEPSSDFNFVGLWSYNTENAVEICSLNNNLVVKFADYESLKPFFSFLGISKVTETATRLLEFSRQIGIGDTLKLIPEIVGTKLLADIQTNHISMQEDRDNYDYILSIDNISKMDGKDFAMQRNLIHRYQNRIGTYKFQEIDITKLEIQNEIDSIFTDWEANKKSGKIYNNERAAIKRIVREFVGNDIRAYGIFQEGEHMVGFSISELLANDLVVAHFRKGDVRYPGIFQLLEKETCIALSNLGYKYMNYEQDLGIPGLRASKEEWHPVKFLKKYKVGYR
jgi:hypothetical protein